MKALLVVLANILIIIGVASVFFSTLGTIGYLAYTATTTGSFVATLWPSFVLWLKLFFGGWAAIILGAILGTA